MYIERAKRLWRQDPVPWVSLLLFSCATSPLGILGCGPESTPEPEPTCPDCSELPAAQCQQMVCDADSATCVAAPVEDGTPCNDETICSFEESCVAGACEPGVEIRCDDSDPCQETTCNPVLDQCEYDSVPGGTSCATPCRPDATCSRGRCVGEETDCSGLDDVCTVGECDEVTGECRPLYLDVDTECPLDDTSCAEATCDGAGACVERPFEDGTPCDDGDPCTGGDACRSGVCETTPITECVHGDGCCLAACADVDDDCCTVVGPGSDLAAWTFAGEAEYIESAGYAAIVPEVGGVWGQLWLAHDITRPFEARFRYRAPSDRGEGGDGDGMVFMFYKDPDFDPAPGGHMAFMASGHECVPASEGTGYGFKIDNYATVPCDSEPDVFALVHNRIGNHIDGPYPDERTIDGAWHDVVVTVGEAFITVDVDGTNVLSWSGIIDRSHGSLGFGSGTGWERYEYAVDDIEISCL